MAITLDEAGYAAWRAQRILLTQQETFVLDAATHDFIESRKTPAQTPTKQPTPPRIYAEWIAQRVQLTTNETAAIDTVTETLIATRKEKKPPPKAPPPPPTIQPTDYPKWWKEERLAAISLSSAGTQEIIKTRTGYKLFIAAIVLSVSDETDIFFHFGAFGITGTMHFGGDAEPKAMVMTMGDMPAPIGPGPFSITSQGSTASVGGFVVYSEEKEQKPPKKL